MSENVVESKSDFVSFIQDAKRASEKHLKSLGLKEDMSNAVCVGTLGGMVFENENDCPIYIGNVKVGWWFVRTRAGSGTSIVYVNYAGSDDLEVTRAGTEITKSVRDSIAAGMRFLGRVDFPPEYLT